MVFKRLLFSESENKQGGVQVTMVEVVPQNKVQQIKSEPAFEHTAERKPVCWVFLFF